MTKKLTPCLLALFVAAAPIGCSKQPLTLTPDAVVGLSNPSIHILAARSAKVPADASFGWGYCLFKVPQELALNISLVDERLRQAMRATLVSKGMRFAEKEPDFLVSYALAGAGEINDTELNQSYGDLRLPSLATGPESTLHYKRGVLIVDFVDRKSKTLLWRGAIMAEIDMSWPEERKQERCDRAVGELLRHFPQP